MKRLLCVFGTRPEVIKLAPVVNKIREASDAFVVSLCNTAQHRHLSDQFLSFFDLKADIDLDIMKPNQQLASLQSALQLSLDNVFEKNAFDGVIAQGDTMSVFCAALAAFYRKIPFFHVEAGLRSYDLNHPFPEEMIRQCVSRMAAIHFAPTESAKVALEKEGIASDIVAVTGNTVVDAALYMIHQDLAPKEESLSKLDKSKKTVLVTVHRRENHGERLDSILSALSDLSKKYQDINWVLPVHPNPNVKEKVYSRLSDKENIFLTAPLDYPDLFYVMKRATLILSDSGGIQEEAPCCGCPVLVLRDKTERTEGIEKGLSKLVGSDYDNIVQSAKAILDQPYEATRVNPKDNPYGDGQASDRIVKVLLDFFKMK